MLGRLQWAAPFIPGYKCLVAPIEGLLAQRGNVHWTEQCTAALNTIINLIHSHLQLRLLDPKQPCKIYPNYDSEFALAVLM